jgi:pimeloyl-ACP methyl ester carboxylesterase
MSEASEPSSRFIDGDGIRLHAKTLGPRDGPLVLLLHGFPARWSTWRAQMRALADAGFFVVAPDLRGVGESEKPPGVDAYSVLRFVDDVAAIIRGLDRERAFVAGHDFGGGVAWATAMSRPELVTRLCTINSIHPVGIEKQMRRWAQIKKSWYVFFFLLPRLPEWWLSRNDFRFVKRSLMDDGLTAESVDDVIAGLRHEGAMHATVDWYRASFRDVAKKRFVPAKVDAPMLSIWGDRERHFVPELAEPPADFVPNARVAHVPDGGHWVHHEAPEKVSALLIEHFTVA